MYGLWMTIVLAGTGGAPFDELPSGSGGPATDLIEAETPKPASNPAPVLSESYLLLDDDSIVAGQIRHFDGQYSVRREGARMSLPESRVQMAAESLHEIYRFKAARVPIQDPDMRARLAEWCFKEGLLEFAVAEANLILQMKPDHVVAKRILRLCAAKHRQENPDPDEIRTSSVSSRRPRQPEPTRVISQFRAAYGQDLFLQFKEMEPHLMNACGSAGCHGASRHEGPFRLYRRSQGAPNDIQITARNLNSLLAGIDYHDPLRSPILYKALERHGSSSLPPLGGVQDPTYMDLQEWVTEITHRWSGNEIPVDPAEEMEPIEEAPVEGEDGDTFASGRIRKTPGGYVRRTSRPRQPALQPGSMPGAPGFGPIIADDMPAQSYERTADGSPVPRYVETDPDDALETVTAEEMARPLPQPTPQQVEKPGMFRGAASRFIEMVTGRPKVKSSIKIPTGKEGESFEAATPPFNLDPDFNNGNQLPPE